MSKTLLPPDHEHFIARSNNYGFQLTNVTHYVRTFELYLLFSLVFVPTAYTDCNLNWHEPRLSPWKQTYKAGSVRGDIASWPLTIKRLLVLILGNLSSDPATCGPSRLWP